MDAEGLVAMVTKLSVALRTFQRTSMSTYTRVAVAQTKQLQDIITAGNFTLLELAPVMVAIEESSFPEESKKTLQTCIGEASVIGNVDVTWVSRECVFTTSGKCLDGRLRFSTP